MRNKPCKKCRGTGFVQRILCGKRCNVYCTRCNARGEFKKYPDEQKKYCPKMCFARIIGGELQDDLKNIDIFGFLRENGEFAIYGCKDDDQHRFYQGLLNYDKKTGVQGWETVEDVAEWWKEPDMLLVVNKGDYELVYRQPEETKNESLEREDENYDM